MLLPNYEFPPCNVLFFLCIEGTRTLTLICAIPTAFRVGFSGNRAPSWHKTRPTGRVQLLTHLAYMGYCFNPVSFYYCLDESEDKIETVVGEVKKKEGKVGK